MTAANAVDVGALANSITDNVSRRIAETIAQTIGNLAEDDEVIRGRRLNHHQDVELIHNAIRHFDGTELAVADDLKATLEREHVETWGLDRLAARYLEEGDAPGR